MAYRNKCGPVINQNQDTQMQNYQIETMETAPEKSKPLLELFVHAVGFVPNLAGAVANSPVLANSLLGLFQNVHGGSFTEAEVQVLLLTNAVTNASSWPVAFHTALGLKQGLDPADVQAIREGKLPKQKRYAALSATAKKLIENRGQLSDDDVTAFLQAGFEKEHLLELIAVVAASTITNYAGKITNPPLEEFLQEHAWRG
jgi:alkylhydroperoxidase family enzyme